MRHVACFLLAVLMAGSASLLCAPAGASVVAGSGAPGPAEPCEALVRRVLDAYARLDKRTVASLCERAVSEDPRFRDPLDKLVVSAKAYEYRELGFADWHAEEKSASCLVVVHSTTTWRDPAGKTSGWGLLRVAAGQDPDGEWRVQLWADVASIPNDPLMQALNRIVAAVNARKADQAAIDSGIEGVPPVALAGLAERLTNGLLQSGGTLGKATTIAWAQAGLLVARRAKDPVQVGYVCGAKALTLATDGDYTGAVASINEGLAGLAGSTAYGVASSLYQMRAEVAADRGQYAEAIHDVDLALGAFDPSTQGLNNRLGLLGTKARLQATAGDPSAATTVAEYRRTALLPDSGRSPAWDASAEFALGESLASEGKREDGEAQMRRALATQGLSQYPQVASRLRIRLAWFLIDCAMPVSAMEEIEQCRREAAATVDLPLGGMAERTLSLANGSLGEMDLMMAGLADTWATDWGRQPAGFPSLSPSWQNYQVALWLRRLDAMSAARDLAWTRTHWLGWSSPGSLLWPREPTTFPFDAGSVDAARPEVDYLAKFSAFRRAPRERTSLSFSDWPEVRDQLKGGADMAWALAVTGRLGGARLLIDQIVQRAKEYGEPRITQQANLMAATVMLGGGATDEADRFAGEAGRVWVGSEGEWDATLLHALVLERKGRVKEAISTYRSILASVYRVRETQGDVEYRAGLLRYAQKPTFNACRLLAAQGRAAEAFELAESYKGRTLAEALLSPAPAAANALTDRQSDELRALDEGVTEQETAVLDHRPAERSELGLPLLSPDMALAAKRTERELYLRSLDTRAPEAKRFRPAAVADLGPIVAEGPSGARRVIFSYLCGESGTIAFVVRSAASGRPVLEAYLLGSVQEPPGDQTGQGGPDEPAGEAGAERQGAPGQAGVKADLVSACAGREGKPLDPRAVSQTDCTYAAPAREWYQTLIVPLESALSRLGPDDEVIISPDVGLYRIPFPALIDGRNRHLIEHVAISYAHSCTVLALLNGRPKVAGSARPLRPSHSWWP